MPPATGGAPAGALDTALDGIAARYGAHTAAFVALQLEYARPSAPRGPRLAGGR